MTESSDPSAELRLLKFEWLRPVVVYEPNHPLLDVYVKSAFTETSFNKAVDLAPFILFIRAEPWIETRPLDDPNILNAFAQPDPSDEMILNLFRIYGPLSNYMSNYSASRVEALHSHILTNEYVIESMSKWRYTMKLLAISVKLYEYSTYQITSIELKNFIMKYPHEAFQSILLQVRIPPIEDLTVRDSQFLIFQILLAMQFRIMVEVQTEWDEQAGEVTWSLVPHDLESAVWTLFTQSVAGRNMLKRCQHCAKIYTHAVHQDRMYCSGACKQRASRSRRHQQA